MTSTAKELTPEQKKEQRNRIESQIKIEAQKLDKAIRGGNSFKVRAILEHGGNIESLMATYRKFL